MTGWTRWAVASLVALAGTCALLVGEAAWRWDRATARLAEPLTTVVSANATPSGHGATAGAVRLSSLDALESLPPPVRRYFRAVLRDGQRPVRVARLRWTGTLRLTLAGDRRDEAGWRAFDATQVFATEPPGFVWDARIHVAPLASVRVRDAYVGGHGSMRAAALAILRIVDEHDRPELDAGALHRYLGESVWFPTALLPSDRLTWTPMDDRHALATLSDGANVVSLEFDFAPSGEIVAAFTPRRYRARGGGYEPAPWGGVYRRYQENAGMRIPLEAEVYWKRGGETLPYWRGQVVRAEYEFAP